MTDELGTPGGGAEGRPARTPGQPGNAKARADVQQGAAPAPKKISDVPEPPEIITGRGYYVSQEPRENEPARPPRTVSRAPDPPPRIEYSCTPREPKQKEPEADADLKDAESRCEELIRSARTLRRFRGSLWDAEKKRWPFYRKQIDEGRARCGLSDDPAFQRKIDKLDHEWEVACELRETAAAAAALEASYDAAYAAPMQRATGANDPDRVELLKNAETIDRALDIASAIDEVQQRQENAAREQRAEWIDRIERWLEKPVLRDRTHFRVGEIIKDRVTDNPERRAAYLDAFEAAVTAGLFNEGKRKRSQLVCVDDAGNLMRLTKDALATYRGDTANQNEMAAAVRGFGMDRETYRARRLEDLTWRTWMPRRFVARWLTGYNLSPLPLLAAWHRRGGIDQPLVVGSTSWTGWKGTDVHPRGIAQR